jgi:elongation factor 2
MVNFSIAQIRKMMDKSESIRNISVIAHVDHGKSTLTDSLIGKAGIIADARQGEARFMDTRDDEQARSITIKSTCVSLYYERTEIDENDKPLPDKVPYLINLIDSPGHVDFSSEVTAALRVTDGALVVVDCIEGVCVQTETVLRQAIAERIKPILFVNKLDRIFLELSMTPEETFKSFRNSIESVNVIVETYNDESLGEIQVTPESGRVGFGSGLHAWGFTLRDFARMYANKFGMTEDKMMKKFWGNNCWHPKLGKWVRHDPVNNPYKKEGKPTNLARGFCQFIMQPMVTLFDAIMQESADVYWPIIEALQLNLTHEERELVTKPLLKVVMRKWIPAGNALLDMIVEHLPSPNIAQKYRCDILYSGDPKDAICDAIRACDSKGDLSMYVSKMVPTSEKGRFIAFGRVFSGTVKTGQSVRIYGPDYTPGKKRDLYVKKVQRTLLMMGRYVEQLADCPCGNMVGLVGVDQYILKSGTITTDENALPFVTMKFSVSAVVRVAVEPKSAQDLPKLVEGLKRLSKSDPLVKTYTEKTGEHIIAGAGELHLEICLKDLKEQYMKGAGLNVSEPVVSYCEGISAKTGGPKHDDSGEFPDMIVAKSPNKHNRLYMWAEPMGEDLCKAIDEKDIWPEQDFKVRARMMANDYGWQVGDARKIWSFGCPPDALPNTIVDAAKGVQFLNEIKDHVVGAFMQASGGGVIADEIWRGVRINIDDVTLHADAIHRGAGQIMPCAKKVFYAAQIASSPCLFEPMFLVDITVPQQALSGVYNTLSTRRGEVAEQQERPGTPLVQIRAYLPVAESFGFTQLLRQKTAGQAFPQMKFDHWAKANGNPFKEGSPAYDTVMAMRKRKGLKEEMPQFMDYYDRI